MTKNLWKNLKNPIIGLAPMDGYTDSAFRRVCKAINPNIIVYTEFVSADGLFHKAEKLIKTLHFHESESPLVAQIFGKNCTTMAYAAVMCEKLGFDAIDINMGCPARKVVNSEHGMALRKKPELAYKIVESIANATTLPVSVKTRLGFKNATDLIEFGIGVQQAGADMLCVHARTYHEPYKVPAHWDPVYELKEFLSIPVIGNGGITSLDDGMSKLRNLDGFLIGQAAIGNPWIFDPENQKNEPTPIAARLPLIKHHAEWLIEHKGEETATRQIRKHLLKYVSGHSKAKELRKNIVSVTNLDEIVHILKQFECN